MVLAASILGQLAKRADIIFGSLRLILECCRGNSLQPRKTMGNGFQVGIGSLKQSGKMDLNGSNARPI